MAVVYANSSDGSISSGTQNFWSQARDNSSGTVGNQTSTSYIFAVSTSRFGGRGGGNTYRCIRSYMWFDTSGITGTVSAATIKLRGVSGATDGNIIAVKSTAFGGDGGTPLGSSDFDAMPGWTNGASAEGNVTKYSSPAIGAGMATTFDGTGYNDLASTSDLRSDMQNNDAVIICFMDYTYDYLNSAPTANQTKEIGLYYTDYTGTSRDPYIDYTVATGYGNSVNGVASANISKINGIATADIDKVNAI